MGCIPKDGLGRGEDEEMLVSVESPLVPFDRTIVFPKGIARLMVQSAERTLPINFLVMESKSVFNAIMGEDDSCHAWGGLDSASSYEVPVPRWAIHDCYPRGLELDQEVSYDLYL